MLNIDQVAAYYRGPFTVSPNQHVPGTLRLDTPGRLAAVLTPAEARKLSADLLAATLPELPPELPPLAGLIVLTVALSPNYSSRVARLIGQPEYAVQPVIDDLKRLGLIEPGPDGWQLTDPTTPKD